MDMLKFYGGRGGPAQVEQTDVARANVELRWPGMRSGDDLPVYDLPVKTDRPGAHWQEYVYGPWGDNRPTGPTDPAGRLEGVQPGNAASYRVTPTTRWNPGMRQTGDPGPFASPPARRGLDVQAVTARRGWSSTPGEDLLSPNRAVPSAGGSAWEIEQRIRRSVTAAQPGRMPPTMSAVVTDSESGGPLYQQGDKVGFGTTPADYTVLGVRWDAKLLEYVYLMQDVAPGLPEFEARESLIRGPFSPIWYMNGVDRDAWQYVKATVYDVFPPDGSFSVADCHFRVVDAGLKLQDDYLADKVRDRIVAAAAEKGVTVLGTRVWRSADPGIVTREYMVQIAAVEHSPVAGGVLAILLILAFTGLVWVTGFSVERNKDIWIGRRGTPATILPPGIPAPEGAVHADGTPIAQGETTVPGDYIPGQPAQKGVLDTLTDLAPLALAALGLVVLSNWQKGRVQPAHA